MKSFQQNLTIALVIFGVLMLAAFITSEEEKNQTDLYCEMVELRNSSDDPNLGWPDYKGIYDEVCRRN